MRLALIIYQVTSLCIGWIINTQISQGCTWGEYKGISASSIHIVQKLHSFSPPPPPHFPSRSYNDIIVWLKTLPQTITYFTVVPSSNLHVQLCSSTEAVPSSNPYDRLCPSHKAVALPKSIKAQSPMTYFKNFSNCTCTLVGWGSCL